MKKILLMTLLFTLLFPMTSEAAASASCSPVIIAENTDSAISPCADVIETKYRVNPKTGKMQYRRWNASKLRWVDSDWIDL